jgi:hypothetical protein
MTHVRMTHMFFLLNLGHAWMNKAKFYQLIFVLVYLNKRLIGELTLNQSFNFFFSKPKLQLVVNQFIGEPQLVWLQLRTIRSKQGLLVGFTGLTANVNEPSKPSRNYGLYLDLATSVSSSVQR